MKEYCILENNIYLCHKGELALVDLICRNDTSSCRSSCSTSLIVSGPKSSPNKFLKSKRFY